MKLANLLKNLNSYEWQEEESMASFHNLTHWHVCYVSSYLAYHQPLFTLAIFYSLTKEYFFEETLVDEARTTFNWAWKRFLQNRQYFKKKLNLFEAVLNKIIKHFFIVKSGIKGLSNRQLYDLLSETLLLGRKQYGYSIIVESSDILEEKDFLNVLPKLKDKEASKIIQVMSQPLVFGVVDRERFSFLHLAKKSAKNAKIKATIRKGSVTEIKNTPSFKDALARHVKNFFWIQNNFHQAKYLDEKYFLEELKHFIKHNNYAAICREWRRLKNKPRLISSQQKKIIKKLRLSEKARAFFNLLQLFTRMQDERKEAVQRLVYCIDQILCEVAKRHALKRSDLDYYTVKETLLLIKNNRIINRNIFEKRKYKKNIVLISLLRNKKIIEHFLFGKQARLVIDYFEERKKIKARSGIIKGFVASTGRKPRVSGRVRIVFNPAKAKDFQKGDILVAGMTRPEFVPLMRKAGAVVTNEGGITTHAAIVSRELGIPCIIGTKIATQVLRSGDMVEVDATRGIVKKL